VSATFVKSTPVKKVAHTSTHIIQSTPFSVQKRQAEHTKHTLQCTENTSRARPSHACTFSCTHTIIQEQSLGFGTHLHVASSRLSRSPEASSTPDSNKRITADRRFASASDARSAPSACTVGDVHDE